MRISMFVSVAVLSLGSVAVAGTVGYWRFDEGTVNTPATGINTVLDSSGNGLHGTPVNGPVYRSDLPGAAPSSDTRSLEFNGSTAQRVDVPDGPLLALTHSLTLEAFVKTRPLQPGTGGFGVIVMRADNRPGLDPYVLGMQSPGNILTFQIENASNDAASLSATVPYDQWLHVAGTLDDATGAMKLYVNGSLVASTTTAIRPLGALDPSWSPGLSIGEDYIGQYGEAFNGLLDEVRISDMALAPIEFVPEPGTASLLLLAGVLPVLWRLRTLRSKAN